MKKAIGIDLGVTRIKAVLMSESGEILHQLSASTGSSANAEGRNWKENVAGMVRELKSLAEVDAIGLAAPGLANEANSAIRLMPERLKGLENFIWSEFLEERAVRVLNDAHAALIAESSFGAGRGLQNLVMLTLGTGVGGGLLIRGELYQGNHQMAGHLGHITLDSGQEERDITGVPGSLENAIGDVTVAKRSLGRYQTTHALVEAYGQGDPFAAYVWLSSVRSLALGICSLWNTFSPDMLILGGGVTKAGEALYKPLWAFIDAYEWKNAGSGVRVQQAHYADMAGAVGAAGFALRGT